jgi:cytochrome b involved in lipid metabolism
MSSKTFISKNYETRSKKSWIYYGKKHRKLLIFYGADVWDLTQFSEVHPGSKKTIQKYIFEDVEDSLFDICPMTKSRVESFKSFKIGIIQTKRDSR